MLGLRCADAEGLDSPYRVVACMGWWVTVSCAEFVVASFAGSEASDAWEIAGCEVTGEESIEGSHGGLNG